MALGDSVKPVPHIGFLFKQCKTVSSSMLLRGVETILKVGGGGELMEFTGVTDKLGILFGVSHFKVF